MKSWNIETNKIHENRLKWHCRKTIAGQAEKGETMNEEMSVFKSYLRRLLQDLKDLKEALKNKEHDKAENLVDKLIEGTQKGLED